MGHIVSNFQSSGAGFPLTRALNFGTNADRWAVVHVFYSASGTLTDVTVNGVSLTQRATGTSMGGGTHRIYEGAVAGTGSLNVVVSGTGAAVCWMTCAAYDGVSGYRASSAVLKVSGAGLDNITATNTVSGDFVWCGGNDNTLNATFAGTSGTTTLAANPGEFALGKIASGSSTQLDFTITPSGSWQGGVLALVPTVGADTTPPTLTTPTGTQTGATTATGTVSTDEGNGTLYRLASTNATETAATVVAAALSQAVTATGVQNVTFSGLTSSTTYYAHYVQDDAAANRSARVSSSSFTTAVGPDVTNPVMNGTLAVTLITTTGYVLTYVAASDNVAVTGYERSLNGGSSWTDIGNVLTSTVTGRTPGSTDAVQIRAYDAAGNRSAPITANVSLTGTSVSTGVISNGSGTVLANLTVNYTFWPLGRIGSVTGITPVEGTSITNSSGILVLGGLPAGAGVLMVSYRAPSGLSDATTDKVYYEAVTVV